MQQHELDTDSKVRNTTVGQVLKDLAGLRIPQIVEDVKTLLGHLTPQDIATAEDVYKRHKYPSRVITFGRLSTYDNYNLSGLTATAQAVLFLLCRCASQDNYVAVTIQMVCDEVGIVEKTARQTLRLLRMSGVIALARPAARHMPATYMIDPDLLCIGKAVSEADKTEFSNIRDKDELYISPEISKKDNIPMIVKTPQYMQTTTRMQQNNRNISIGQLTDYVPPALRKGKKKLATEGNDNETFNKQ